MIVLSLMMPASVDPVSRLVAIEGGAASRPAPDPAAYPHRDARFVMNAHDRRENLAGGAHCTTRARDLFSAATPCSTGGVHVNFLTDAGTERVRAACGPSYDRLAQVKRMYDPDNIIRTNQKIVPERASCVSARGSFDQAGNLAEWLADRGAAPSVCPGWGSLSDDAMCFAGASTTEDSTGAPVRSSAFAALGAPGADPFSIVACPPLRSTPLVGFRCVP